MIFVYIYSEPSLLFLLLVVNQSTIIFFFCSGWSRFVFGHLYSWIFDKFDIIEVYMVLSYCLFTMKIQYLFIYPIFFSCLPWIDLYIMHIYFILYEYICFCFLYPLPMIPMTMAVWWKCVVTATPGKIWKNQINNNHDSIWNVSRNMVCTSEPTKLMPDYLRSNCMEK